MKIMKNPYNPETEPLSHLWWNEKQSDPKEYIRYGEDWEKEMSKFSKHALIQLLKKALTTNNHD